MKAKVVTCDDDVRAFYYYKKSEPKKPDEYPCVMIQEDCDGGVGGWYYHYRFHYVPKTLGDIDVYVYLLGVVDGIQYSE